MNIFVRKIDATEAGFEFEANRQLGSEQFHHDLRAARRIGIARARRILEEFRAR